MTTLAESVGAALPSGLDLAALLPILLLVIGLVAYCLVDLVRASPSRWTQRPASSTATLADS